MQIKKSWISEDKLRPYMEAALLIEDDALQLYLTDRKLSSALFQDISFIEVTLRNRIHMTLSNDFGPDWFTNPALGFDKRVVENLSEAWTSLPSKYTSNRSPDNTKLGGRLIAASMFRTWTNMLDAGGPTGLPAPFDKTTHDKIWNEQRLLSVFPGAKIIARAKDPSFETYGLTRGWVYQQVLPVRKIRNRIAHHESLINGVPITGTSDRLPAQDCFQACKTLAFMLDRDLESFISDNSSVPPLLNQLNRNRTD